MLNSCFPQRNLCIKCKNPSLTCSSCLQQPVVCSSQWSAVACGLQQPVVCSSLWSAAASGLQQPVVCCSLWCAAACGLQQSSVVCSSLWPEACCGLQLLAATAGACNRFWPANLNYTHITAVTGFILSLRIKEARN